jgi:hypothetical protein
MAQVIAKPRPLELLARLLIAAAISLCLANWFAAPIVRLTVPLITRTAWALSDDFIITSAVVETPESEHALRVHANLARPVIWNHRPIYPFGWEGTPLGGFEVTLTLAGVLQYCVLLITLALAWPVHRMIEFVPRLVVAGSLGVVLILVSVPFTILAELRNCLPSVPQVVATDPWMIWSRFLMGGGGAVLAIVLAAIAVFAGTKIHRYAEKLLIPTSVVLVARRPYGAVSRRLNV